MQRRVRALLNLSPTNPSEAHLSGFQGVVQTEYLSRVLVEAAERGGEGAMAIVWRRRRNMYSTANKLATELKNGRRELLTALLFWLQHRREVRGRGRGRVWCNFIIVSLLPLSRRGWIGANNDGGRSRGQKRTRIQGMTD